MCIDMMWCEIAFQNWNQTLILLRSKGRPKFHINKGSLGYLYCNVQYCVGNGSGIWIPRMLHSTSFNGTGLSKRLSAPALVSDVSLQWNCLKYRGNIAANLWAIYSINNVPILSGYTRVLSCCLNVGIGAFCIETASEASNESNVFILSAPVYWPHLGHAFHPPSIKTSSAMDRV
jgi:hypothetical protein